MHELYPRRHANYVQFLEENGLEHNLTKGATEGFSYTADDLVNLQNITQQQIAEVEARLHKLETSGGLNAIERTYQALKKNPLARLATRLVKRI